MFNINTHMYSELIEQVRKLLFEDKIVQALEIILAHKLTIQNIIEGLNIKNKELILKKYDKIIFYHTNTDF